MCDTARGVVAAVPRQGPAAELARAALDRVRDVHHAHELRSLDEELDGPVHALLEFEPPAWHPVLPPFSVELYRVPPGSEQAFVEDVRREYLEAVIAHPQLLPAIADPWERLVVSLNVRLHPAGVFDPVPDPFEFDSTHQRHLRTIGLDYPVPSTAPPVTVAVLDNGFDYHYWSRAPAPQPIGRALDLVPSDGGTSGHGTLVAALIKDAAPTAEVVPIRMAGADSTEFDALHALARAVEIDAAVMTLSYRQLLGTDLACEGCGVVRRVARSEVMERMIDWASVAQGQERAILAAAGNDGTDVVARLARSPAAVSITALDDTGTSLAWFSNWDASGEVPVMAVPGVRVALNTRTRQHYEGTSFATAYVAAVYAEAMMRWSMSAREVTRDLRHRARRIVRNATVVRL